MWHIRGCCNCLSGKGYIYPAHACVLKKMAVDMVLNQWLMITDRNMIADM